MWDVEDLKCWGCGMFGMWDVLDVGCWGCKMLGMWNVRNLGCLGCGMFGMWDVGCGMLIYKMPYERNIRVTFVRNCVWFQQKNLEKSHEISLCLSTVNVQSQLNLIYKNNIKHAKMWSFLLPVVPFLAVFQQ